MEECSVEEDFALRSMNNVSTSISMLQELSKECGEWPLWGIREKGLPLKRDEQMGVVYTTVGGRPKLETSARERQRQRQIKPRSQISHPAHPTSVIYGSARVLATAGDTRDGAEKAQG